MKKLLMAGVLVLISLNLCTGLRAQPIFRGINCGSTMFFTSSQGDIYIPDLEYPNSYGYGYQGENMTVPIPNRTTGGIMDLDSLYYTRREGEFTYIFDNLPDTTYAVIIHLCEKTHHWYGFRAFSICIEGDTLVRDLDIFAQTGRSYAWPLRFLVECHDGQLNIDFIPSVDEATVSGISVRSISSDYVPPAQIAGFNVINGYEINILYWNWSSEPDLAGYWVYRRETGQNWQLITPEINPQYRYIDRDVVPGVEYEYTVTAEDHWGNESIFSDSLTATPIENGYTQFPRYNMDITEENLYLLNINIWSDDYVAADLTLENEYIPACSVRYRGSYTRPHDKKNYKLKLAEGELHNVRRKFNLQSGWYDASMMLGRLGFQSFDLLNCLNPFTQNIHLERNDEFIGLYLDIEQVDNYFLERNGLSPSGNLFQCEGTLAVLGSYEAYEFFYQNENNEELGLYDLIDFIEWLNNCSLAEFFASADSCIAVDDFIDCYLVLVSTADPDMPHSSYMYSNPADGRWYYIPWDHNEGFEQCRAAINWGTQAEPIFEQYNVLMDKVLAVPLFRYSYCKKLERFLTNEFSVQSVQDWIAAIYDEIYFDAIRDIYKWGWERPDSFLVGTEPLNQFIASRVPFLLGEIPGFITDPDLTPYFRFNEIQSDNQTTIADEAGDFDPWVEIYNLAPVELDLENFVLHYGGQSWTLPAEAVVDDHGFLLLWLDGEPGEGPLHASFALSSGSGNLRLEGRQGGVIADSVTFPVLAADHVWARAVDGIGNWVAGLPPTPGSTNNPPQDPSALVVNEFLAINDSANPDPAGDYDDWLEIFNPSADTIPLAGIHLTDDLTRPTRWAFPDTFIAPHSFVLIWCDNEPTEGPLHATFALDGDGEQIGLYHRDSTNPIDTLTFGDQQADVSYGRYPDGSDNWMFLYPTPGDSNNPPAVQGGSANASIPREFSLEPNFPNPFNPQTVIRFALPKSTHVQLKIYDLLGREVATLQEGMMKAGYHSVFFDGSQLASGIYFCHLEAGDFRASQKMVLIK